MICPYIVNRKTITQSNIEYNEEEQQTSWTEIQNNIASAYKCQEENCAAFKNGRCCYGEKT